MVAVANHDYVLIFALSQNKSQLLKEIRRPSYVGTSETLKRMPEYLPAITWGFGHSPIFKDKCYANLIVAWGPLLQMYVLNDVMDQNDVFFEDGYHVMEPTGGMQNDSDE